MKNYFFQPSPFLAPYVEYYFVIEDFEFSPETLGNEGVKVFPAPQCEMVFSYGDSVNEKWLDKPPESSPCFAIGGYATRPVEYFSNGATGSIMVGFKPWGIQAFLDFAAKEITNSNSDMALHFGREVLFVEEKLREASGIAERIRIVEAFLAGRLRRPVIDKEMVRAVEIIAASEGVLQIEELARQCFMSRRQLLRRFEASIGISPKLFSRLIRFQRVFEKMKAKNEKPDWSQTAFDAGYSDQAHFINEFREFSGCAPAQFVHDLKPTPVGEFFGENSRGAATYGKIYL
jgi:AraC-like DNA-binding protein